MTQRRIFDKAIRRLEKKIEQKEESCYGQDEQDLIILKACAKKFNKEKNDRDAITRLG